MKVDRREIWEVNVLLPNGKFKPHPCIVLSGENVLDLEEAAIVVMLTSTDVNDEFSFHITNDMITFKPKKPKLQARIQLIALTPISQFVTGSRFGYLKQPHFDNLIAKINSTIFAVN